MNRRVLVIDADAAFRDTLTKQLARYRVVVVTEPDAERALAAGAADPPALIIIAVEEPEKAGYRAFQKCKKGALAKVPMLRRNIGTFERFSRPSSRPPTTILPPVGSSSLSSSRTSVDLPEPEAPTTNTNSPLSMWNVTSCSAVTSGS